MAAAQVAKKLKDKRKQRTIEGIFKKASKVVAEQRMEIDHLWCETMKKFYRSEKCLSNCFTRDKTFAHLQFCIEQNILLNLDQRQRHKYCCIACKNIIQICQK